MPQYFFECYDNLKEWNVSFKSQTDRTSYAELPNTGNVSFSSGYAKFLFAIPSFRCLKSVTTLSSFRSFLLINITGLESAEKTFLPYT